MFPQLYRIGPGKDLDLCMYVAAVNTYDNCYSAVATFRMSRHNIILCAVAESSVHNDCKVA